MKNWTCAALLAAAIMSLGAAEPAPTRSRGAAEALQGRLTIAGSNTMAPLVAAIAKRFQALHPGVVIEVRAGGSARGLEDVRRGRVDVGLVSRALGAPEHDIRGLPIARDGVAVAVHRDNPVRTLDDAQVADIYTGKLANWKQVGGRDAPIVAYRAEGWRASSELFASYFQVPGDAMKARPAQGEAAARLKTLEQSPDAILYTSVSLAERAIEAGAPIRLLPAGGVAATSRNIRNGNFPISRALTLATGERPSALAKAFIEYCGTSQITDLVVGHDFVPYLD